MLQLYFYSMLSAQFNWILMARFFEDNVCHINCGANWENLYNFYVGKYQTFFQVATLVSSLYEFIEYFF
jgi:hypothetical protein